MTKKELSQLRHLNKEIEMLKQQIANLENQVEMETVSDVVSGSNSEWPYERRRFHIEGIDVKGYEKRLRRLRRKLIRRLEELIKKQKELEEYINAIPDSELRIIFTLRYVEGLSWQQIADYLGVQGDGSTQRKKHDRYLKISRNS